MTVLERFLNYVVQETTSDPSSKTYPSTTGQIEFARFLVGEMRELGIADAHMDTYGYVFGTLPANVETDAPTIGLIAHMDTSPDMLGRDVTPRIVRAYDGGDIVLNRSLGITLSPKEFPNLANYTGQDLVVTDGTTLLGADDKAGIAEILTAVEWVLRENIPHGTIKLAFTPDEEIGKGTLHFDVEAFGADYAYTIDGGAVGGLEYENFNGASGFVTVNGKGIHPGTAKGQMINANLIGMEFHHMLPVFLNPANTEGYEGFIHLNEFSGAVEHAEMVYILRDHDKEKLDAQKDIFHACAEFLNKKYGGGTVTAQTPDSYPNMREFIEPHMEIIERAETAMQQFGITPIITPIRGGTDGATLSAMGLPCPNLCTGGENFHGKFEFISIQAMEACTQIIKNIITNLVTE